MLAMTTTPTAYLVLVAVPQNNGTSPTPPHGAPPRGHTFVLGSQNIIGRPMMPPAHALNIELPWVFVSRRHALIEVNGAGTWEIEDLGSRNGTYANNQQVQPGCRVHLHDGDLIDIGCVPSSLQLRFCLQLAPTAPLPVRDGCAAVEDDLPVPLIVPKRAPPFSADHTQ
jgi:hypothetical protein